MIPAAKLDPRVVRRAAEAWKRANGNVSLDAAPTFEGETADQIIRAVAPWRPGCTLYYAYERAVRERVRAECPPREKRSTNRGSPVPITPRERAAILDRLRAGDAVKEVAKQFQRTPPTIYQIRQKALSA